MQDEMRNYFKNKTQVFEDNGGGLYVVGQRKNGQFEYQDGIEHAGHEANGLYDIQHIDDFDYYQDDIEEALKNLYNAMDVTKYAEPVACVAEYDHKTKKLTLYPEKMGAAARTYMRQDLTGRCMTALEGGKLPDDAEDLCEEWMNDDDPAFDNTADEIEAEMNRLIEEKAYIVVDNRISSSGNVELGNEKYFFDRYKATREADEAWGVLCNADRKRSEVYVYGPKGFVYFPQVGEYRHRFGDIYVRDGGKTMNLTLIEEPYATWADDTEVMEGYAIDSAGANAKEMPLYELHWDITNPEAATYADCFVKHNPKDWKQIGAKNLYKV